VSMRSFFGIPAHPLLVHVPAVLLPLVAIGVVFMVIKPSWHQRYRWAVLVLGFVGTVGAVLAASAGETFEEQITATRGGAGEARWEDHAEAGETAQVFAIIFFVILAAFILVPWFIERRRNTTGATLSLPRWVTVGMTVLVLAASAASVTTVVLAGHSGAKSVWCDTNNPPNCDN
jgi:formate hydrogenlyase subunit 3/multisubunit Na+/H+ antiporter MnhD subunit